LVEVSNRCNSSSLSGLMNCSQRPGAVALLEVNHLDENNGRFTLWRRPVIRSARAVPFSKRRGNSMRTPPGEISLIDACQRVSFISENRRRLARRRKHTGLTFVHSALSKNKSRRRLRAPGILRCIARHSIRDSATKEAYPTSGIVKQGFPSTFARRHGLTGGRL